MMLPSRATTDKVGTMNAPKWKVRGVGTKIDTGMRIGREEGQSKDTIIVALTGVTVIGMNSTLGMVMFPG